MHKCCVFFEVRTEYVISIWTNFVFHSVNSHIMTCLFCQDMTVSFAWGRCDVIMCKQRCSLAYENELFVVCNRNCYEQLLHNPIYVWIYLATALKAAHLFETLSTLCIISALGSAS